MNTPAGDCSSTPTEVGPAAGTALTASGAGLQRVAESAGYLASTLASDIKAIRERDPAATNTLEILTCYPGLHALWFHRAGTRSVEAGYARIAAAHLSDRAVCHGHRDPSGGQAGERLLHRSRGGSGHRRDRRSGRQRHSLPGSDAGRHRQGDRQAPPHGGRQRGHRGGSQLLGDITVGDNVRVGAGSVVVQNVPPETTVVGNPGRPVISEGLRVGIPDIDYTHLPDPVAEAMKCLVRRVVQIENELEEFRKLPRASDALAARTHGGLDALESSGPVASHRSDRSLPALDRPAIRQGLMARLTSEPADSLLAKDLNEPQREAVFHSGGPLLVLAGAGSGKTRVLTYRLAHLIQSGQVRPHQTLAITFTNKAAGEMKERVAGLLGPASGWMWVCTFHSACARMLRHDAPLLGYRTNFTIYDEDDSTRLIKHCLEDLRLDVKRFPPGPCRASSPTPRTSSSTWTTSGATHWVTSPRAMTPGWTTPRTRGGAEGAVSASAGAVSGTTGPPRRRPTWPRRSTGATRPAAGAQRPRLRRPAHAHGRRAAVVSRAAGVLPRPVPPRARGRIPGHQPGPVPHGQAAHRGAPPGDRGGRRRPVGVLVARGRHPQHPQLRG